tara:strand:- start:756 stop:989 length:234 start_codon:yes stop_codon:yes gene_type:complete
MEFIRSRIDKTEIIMYYKSEDGKEIIEKKYPFHKLPPLTHKRPHKKYPPNSISTSEIYNKIYDCNFAFEDQFNDLEF